MHAAKYNAKKTTTQKHKTYRGGLKVGHAKAFGGLLGLKYVHLGPGINRPVTELTLVAHEGTHQWHT